MIADTPLCARVSHRFAAPAERVYDAFLDVSDARRFLYASPAGRIVRAELDPRVGGTYVLTDRRNSADVEHTGTYLELDRPRRIVFTMFVPGYSNSPDRVSVDITPLESGCELTLTHEMAPDYAPFVDATVSAYTEHLDQLDALLREKS
jgi:uncharacterized protein YndB with AHSA1/START domain